MNILVLLAILAAFLLLQYYSRSSKIIYIKKLLLPFTFSLFLLCLVFFSDTAVSSAKKGLDLWLNIVFPSLFPFFVVSELLSMTGFVRVLGVLMEPVMRPLFNVPGCGSFAFAMGITSGYPVGAKITSSMREEKLVTKAEAERLLAFTNNSGPLFIVGAVAVGMLKNPQLGLFLLACHILACISVGLLFKYYRKGSIRSANGSSAKLLVRFKSEMVALRKNLNTSLGEMLGNAVRNSMATILAIGGFIILFSVLINLLITTGCIESLSALLGYFLEPIGINKDLITAVTSGFFEITTGTSMASKVSGVSFSIQLSAISLIIGWAGLSVHSQVLSIVSKTDISIKPYLFGKFLQGIFSSVYTLIGIKIAGVSMTDYQPAFNNFNSLLTLQWNDCLTISGIGLGASLLMLVLCMVISMVQIILAKGKRLRS
ncbi:MAG: sporulation integral membrane protein YlbJ [Clostridia bacterium]|nr:sporulation integral membrane protein YlbJ [Clostridia bacterium]